MKLLDYLKGLTGDRVTGDLTALNTPALDDNTTKLATTAFIRNEFTGAGKRTAATNGHQYLPGGLLLQWGQTSSVAAGAQEVVTFPIAFPVACLNIQITPAEAEVNSVAYMFAVGAYSRFLFGAVNRSPAQGGTAFWLAIGY